MEEQWITASEFAKLAGVSRQQIHLWRKARLVPYRRFKKKLSTRYNYEYPLSAAKKMTAIESEDIAAYGEVRIYKPKTKS